jgi:hypothetical protein
MKKVILLVVLSVFLSINLYSQVDQLLQYFKVKDCLSNVITKAGADGMSNPKLIYAGAFKRTITANIPNVGNVTVNINFKLEDGTSNLWLYLLSSDEGGEPIYKSYAAAKVLIAGFQVVAIPLDSLIDGNLPIDLTSSLSDNNWVNSDKMAEIFRNSSEVTTFKNKHQPEMISVGVFNNSDIPLFNQGLSIWAMTLEAGSDFLVCAIENSTQEHICSDTPLGIDEQTDVNGFSIYPNPVQGDLNISFGRELTHGRVTLYNLLGNAVINKEIVNTENLTLNTSNLPQGLYYITVESGDLNIRSAVTIIR